MKNNNFLIALALCAAMQSNMSLSSQDSQSQSYWQRYAPQRMQDVSSYVSQKVTNTYDVVSKWSTKKKIAVASAIIGTLAVIYNREQILQWVGDIVKESRDNRIREELFQIQAEHDRANPISLMDSLKRDMDRREKIIVEADKWFDNYYSSQQLSKKVGNFDVLYKLDHEYKEADFDIRDMLNRAIRAGIYPEDIERMKNEYDRRKYPKFSE